MVLRIRYQVLLLALFLAVLMIRNVPFSPRDIITDPSQAAEGGDITKQLLFIIFAVAMAIPLVWPKPRGFSVPLPLLLLFAFGALSATWSLVPLIALRRLALTALITFTLLAGVAQLRPKTTLDVARWVTLTLCVATLLAGILYPSLAIHQPGDPEPSIVGGWRGIFSHKNTAGLVAGLALVLSAEAFMRAPGRLATGLTTVGVAGITLFLTHSRTSAVSSLLAILVIIAFRAIAPLEGSNRRRAIFLRLGIIIVAVMGLAISWFATGMDRYILDPEAFTGRGELWGVVAGLIRHRPVLGYGYQSVFLAGDTSVLNQVTSHWVTTMPSSHNGVLDLLVTLGAIGAGLYFWAMIIGPWHRLQQLPETVRLDWEPVFAGLMTFALVHSLMEGDMFFGQSSDWIVLVILCGIATRLKSVVDPKNDQAWKNEQTWNPAN